MQIRIFPCKKSKAIFCFLLRAEAELAERRKNGELIEEEEEDVDYDCDDEDCFESDNEETKSVMVSKIKQTDEKCKPDKKK